MLISPVNAAEIQSDLDNDVNATTVAEEVTSVGDEVTPVEITKSAFMPNL